MENFPSFNGNWVDLMIILITLIYLAGGWGRGLILGVVDLAGFIISFFTALKSYSFFGRLFIANFNLPGGIANAVGFLLAGVLSEMVFTLVAGMLLKKFYRSLLDVFQDKKRVILRLNKILGFVPAFGEALIFTAFILTLLISLPIQGKVKKDILDSRLGKFLVPKTQSIEKELNSIFGKAVNETLTFLTINANPISGEKVDLKFTTSEGKIDEKAESTMLNLINQERIKEGLNHLTVSFNLRETARVHAGDMFARGYFSHYNPEGLSPFDRMDKKGISYKAAGENLALAPDVYLAHQGLMNSPGHRANILSPDFSKIGIGAVDGGIYGMMFVQEFTN